MLLTTTKTSVCRPDWTDSHQSPTAGNDNRVACPARGVHWIALLYAALAALALGLALDWVLL